ncbi:MAG TPA: hypothetical protein VKU00_25915, partial [Chthonomonadaceae bacterium]|nr:hypothetical protein [Chthonomonadaceae bacterium]
MTASFRNSPLGRRFAFWGALPFIALCATALLAETPGVRPAAPDIKPPAPSRPANPPASTSAQTAKPISSREKGGVVALSGPWHREYPLSAGQTVEISVHLDTPSKLPPNGRVAVSWTLPQNAKAGWRKILHALDGDVYMVYRAPLAGKYLLKLEPVENAPWSSETARWREKGNAPMLASLPEKTPWSAGAVTPVSVSVKPIVIGDAAEQDRLHTYIEMEPNDSPEMAQTIPLTGGDDVRTWEITGGADDVEFFDNGNVGQSGDDWFRLEYKGIAPRLLTAQLSMPGQMVAARIRCYVPKTEGEHKPSSPPLTPLQDVSEYTNGQDQNERAHQQDEAHRTNICRLLQPGKTYFLRVEANSPGYQLQLRTLKPAPYTDPQMAIRQGMYTQIGQVDAWLTNRPRGASVERRIRDSGNLLGTQCMSCHTQSGVWGPAVPFVQGYRPENVQNYWHLLEVMYECLRPTNTIKDAANNTSLAPLDYGD